MSIHFFFFWRELDRIFIRKLHHVHNLSLSKELILFGCKDNTVTDKPLDLLILSAKYYVYSCKFSKDIPHAEIFIKRFIYRYKLEKCYNYANATIDKFDTMWLPYKHMLV